MDFDFNDAKPQRDVIPPGTEASVRMTIKPGGAGDGGWLTRSEKGTSEGLNCEFTLLDGPHEKRKFWDWLLVNGTTDGQIQMAESNRAKFRAMLESARGIRPDDESDAAKQARRVTSCADLDGLCFIARIGVKPPQNGNRAKNTLDRIVTPDEWRGRKVTQSPRPPAGSSAPAASAVKPTAFAPVAIARPQWANRKD
jgi:hypothetical protein